MSEITPGRYAAIDIGTVTCRMYVADVDEEGRLHEVDREYAITNLGEGVDDARELQPQAIERVAAAIEGFLAVLRLLPGAKGITTRVFAVATSAARDARNSDLLIKRLHEMGVGLQVIPGWREASLSFAGAASAFGDESLVVVDVGGGSTEFTAGGAGTPSVGTPSTSPKLISRSFDVGCRRVTERFLHSDPPSDSELADARKWVAAQILPYRALLADAGRQVGRMVAVAGTATSIVSVRERMEVYQTQLVHLSVVTREQLDEQFEWMAKLPLEQRRQIVGLDPDRAPVVLGGLMILQEAMTLLGVDEFTVSESDILQGIVMDESRS